MPSRKQRRRRAKSLRHEYEYVIVDESGEEIEVDPRELRVAKEKDKPKARAADKGGKATGRSGGRTLQPASWRRVAKRSLIFAPLMFLAVSVLDKQGRLGVTGRVLQTLVLLAFFLPFSYLMDSIAYRMYLRRTGQAPPKRDQASRSPR